jgi:hypothetical protein
VTPFRILWARLRGLAGLGWRDADLDEEIATHLDLLAGQYRRRGLSASAARLAARRDFGGLSQTRESYRAQRAFAWLDAIVRDLRFGVRVLRRNPGLATVVVATLGITIGANAVVFSLVDHLLLRPLPFPAPDRLVTIARHAERGTRTYDGLGHDGATWMFLRDHGPALDVALEAGGTSGVNALVHGNAAYVQQRRVSAGYFRVLGIQPFIGREFTADEDRDGGAPVTILSYRFWNRALGADPSAIGHDILLRGERFTIVGVMPSTLHSIAPTDLWTPLHPSTQGEGAGGNYVLLGRLRPGIGLEAARAQVESVGTAFLQDRFHPPADVRMTMRIVPFQQVVTSDIHDRLVVVWSPPSRSC